MDRVVAGEPVMNSSNPIKWDLKRLGDFADIRAGSAFPHMLQGKIDGRYPFYKVSDMTLPGNETVMHNANNRVDDAIVSKLRAKTFPTNTIIFPKVGAAVYTNKKRILSVESLVDNNVMGVTVKNDAICSPEFLLLWFDSIDISDFSNPGPLPSITAQVIKDTIIPLPPLSEQRAIARALRAVQLAKEARQRELALERERKAALMEYLFTHGTRGERRKQTEIGEVPESWEIVPLCELCSNRNGTIQTGPFGSQLHASDYVNTGTPIVNPTHMGFNCILKSDIPCVSAEDTRRLSKHVLKAGDILMVLPQQPGPYVCMQVKT